MPRRDGTGPMAQGPNTGRGAGPCSGDNTGARNQTTPVNPGQGNRPQGNRSGQNISNGHGRGNGRGRGNGSGKGRRSR